MTVFARAGFSHQPGPSAQSPAFGHRPEAKSQRKASREHLGKARQGKAQAPLRRGLSLLTPWRILPKCHT